MCFFGGGEVRRMGGHQELVVGVQLGADVP